VTSIRRRLALSLLAGSVLAFGAAGLILHQRVASQLAQQFDAGLAARAGGLASLLEFDEAIEFDYSSDALPAFAGGADPEYFVLWFADGSEAQRSESLGEATLPRRLGSQQAPEIWDLTLPDGRPGRAFGLVVTVPAKDANPPIPEADLPRVGLVVARSRHDLDATIAALDTSLALAALAVLALLAWGVAWSVRTGLAPVRRLGEEVGRIDAATLSSRIGADDVPEELLPFVLKLNELLARLEAAFARQQRMTAAMAHELRTPIAELRAASDVAARWPADGELTEDLVHATADVAQRMTSAVDAVLRYCRLEAGRAQLELQAVPLRPLVAELWAPHARLAHERGLHLRDDVPEGLALETDRGLLSVVLGNLLGNAAAFASGGEVRTFVNRDDATLTLHVANAADQLRPEDLAHLTEPFWRKDAARSDGRHSGLGLTLVESIAGVLGGRARFALEQGRFVASLTLPSAGRRVAAPAPTPRAPDHAAVIYGPGNPA
jgi:signal transduction histidine kinase